MLSPAPDGTADVLVVGGGITGLSAALALGEAGARVRVVDWGQSAGSNANAGSLHVQLQSRALRLFPELAAAVEDQLPLYVAAVAEWERLEALHGPFDLVHAGGLMVAENDDQLRFLDDKAGRERRRGLDVDILDRAALDRIAPWLGPEIVGAELCRNEGKLNPLLANARLKAAAAAVGVSFASDRIDGIEPDGAFVVARGREPHRARRVLVATGWGSGPLAACLGVKAPAVGEPLHMNITEPADYRMAHLVQHAERPITLKQFASGHIVIGGGWRAEAAEAGPRVRAESLVGNVALAARVAPAIGNLRIIRTWAGLNPVADGRTILARTNLGVVAVPGDAGYTLGPLVGRAAAALLSGGDLPFDPEPFSPARFG